MFQNIKFSIAIPAYKGKYLQETIDSVLAQTCKNYEVVIVNDSSPYNLDNIINRYSDSRIRYFKNERNCGAKDVVDNWYKVLKPKWETEAQNAASSSSSNGCIISIVVGVIIAVALGVWFALKDLA